MHLTTNYTTTQQPASSEAPAGSSDDTLPVGGAEALPLVGAGLLISDTFAGPILEEDPVVTEEEAVAAEAFFA